MLFAEINFQKGGDTLPGGVCYPSDVGQTFLSAGLGDFLVACPWLTELESSVNRQAGKPVLQNVGSTLTQTPGVVVNQQVRPDFSEIDFGNRSSR